MGRGLYKMFLTSNSMMLFVIVYLVKEKIWISRFGIYSIGIYIAGLFVWTAICLLCSVFLSTDSIEGGIQSVELANDSYMPNYIGYFFVALSIPNSDVVTAGFVFLLLLLFIYRSQTSYYNPLFLLFGYQFYCVTNQNNLKVFVISRQEIRTTDNLEFQNLRRISDFTFIDKEK